MRFLITALSVGIITIISVVYSNAAEEKPTSVLTQSLGEPTPVIMINGERLQAEAPPMIVNDVTFIAVTVDFANAIWADVSFDNGVSNYYKVKIKTKESTVEFVERQTFYFVNDGIEELPAAPFMQSGYLMAPARALFESLKFDVAWDGKNGVMNVVHNVPAREIARNDLESVLMDIPTEPEKPATAATATVATAAVAIVKPPAQKEKKSLEYTYDNVITTENVNVSGNTRLSNLVVHSIALNQFNLRAYKTLKNGFALNTIARTISTTDRTQNKGQMEKLTLEFKKGKTVITTDDLMPKFSFYAMKNYQLKGLQYDRANRNFSWTMISGKSPKKSADSEYTRFVQGFRVHRSLKKDRDFGLSFVRTKDTGTLMPSDRISNNVLSLNWMGKMKKETRIITEFALSRTKVAQAGTVNGKARSFQLQNRNSRSMYTLQYERVGSEFDSESAMFTSGKREASFQMNRKASKHYTGGAGWKTILMAGEETRTIPFLISISSYNRFPDMKTTIQRNFEMVRSAAGTSLTDARILAFTNKFGPIKTDFTLDRRKQKDSESTISYKTMRRYRVEFSPIKKTTVALQCKTERRTNSAKPITRFYQSFINYELSDWSAIDLNMSRYYNNSLNNRTGTSLSYKSLNIINNTEINFEYSFFNYSEHNDNTVRISYSFLK